MRRSLLVALLLLAPVAVTAQDITIRQRGDGQAAALLDSVTARPHVVRGGTGPLVFPRDSTIATSLVVVGRPTFLASRVQGDVIVVGGDLFLRPGVDISGRAVAIGGTVAETTLGRVGGEVRSLRDETFDVERTGGGFALTHRDIVTSVDTTPVFGLAGIRGVLIPSYDRVDGLSLPLGVRLNLSPLRLEPTVTYRSRLGVLDPGLAFRIGTDTGTRIEGRVARETRSNDLWITNEIINSLKTLAFGTDTRNYFRSDVAEARAFLHRGGGESAVFEPFVGARFEHVTPISATGDVWSFFDRTDSLKIRRPNPLVEAGHIASALVGLVYQTPDDADKSGTTFRLAAEAEQALTVPSGRSTFTQLSVDGRIDFATFGLQRLNMRGHAVGTLGDSVPRARYAYLGGSRTLALTDLLALGGDQLLFLESRYSIPVERLQLPVVGSPTLVLIHRLGGAGVGSIGSLQQEVGAGLSVSIIDLELIVAASGQPRKTQFGVGVSLPAF